MGWLFSLLYGDLAGSRGDHSSRVDLLTHDPSLIIFFILESQSLDQAISSRVCLLNARASAE
jgi:hypothetical protein